MENLSLNPLPFKSLVPGAAETPFRADELAQTSYRPTVIIGLGGTGLAVVRRLKTLLRRYFRNEELDIFQFIVFDTAAQETPEGEEPLDAGEFCHLGAFDAADMIRHLDENPHIARWWPGGKERPYIPSFSGTGANRVRAVGRLVLFNYMGSVIIPTLQTKINRAIEINAQHGQGATSIKFYLVGSLAGGTCSGMVVDLGYVARMLGLRSQPTAYVTAMLVMEDAFLPKARTQYTAAEFCGNTLGALKEINYFAAARRFRERYDDMTSTDELPDGFRPFDVSYLLGLHNSEGLALESFDELADMVSAEMMLEIASPLHGRAENVLDNVRANDRAIAGQPAAFSSFALSSLVYPLTGIASWCSLRGLASFSQRALLTPRRGAAGVEAEAGMLLNQAGAEARQSGSLLDSLGRDEAGQALSLPSLSYDQVNGLPDDQALGALQRLEEAALVTLAQLRTALAAAVEPLCTHFTKELQAELETCLRDPQRGPRYTAWLASAVEKRLSAQRDEPLSSEQAAFRADMDAYEATWSAARDDLGRALRLPSVLPWRRWQVKAARSAYTSAFNAYLFSAYELERRTQAILACGQMAQTARRLARQASDLLGGWEQLAQAAARQAETGLSQARATQTEYSLMRNIAGPDELRRTFERCFPDLDSPARQDHFASQFWQFFATRFPNWGLDQGNLANPTEDSPAVQAYYFLANWYAEQLRSKTLLDHLKTIYGEGWAREIELRYRQTAPFWNYNLARFGDKIRSNLQNEPQIVGYGEPELGRWSRLVSGATGQHIDGVNNKNPHEMLFLRTSHGLPVFALRQTSQTLRSAYNYLQELWRQDDPGSNPIPVHVSTEWERLLPEIDPQTAPAAAPHTAPAGVPTALNLAAALRSAGQDLPLAAAVRTNGSHAPQADPADGEADA
jgi:hypothetical protein